MNLATGMGRYPRIPRQGTLKSSTITTAVIVVGFERQGMEGIISSKEVTAPKSEIYMRSGPHGTLAAKAAR